MVFGIEYLMMNFVRTHRGGGLPPHIGFNFTNAAQNFQYFLQILAIVHLYQTFDVLQNESPRSLDFNVVYDVKKKHASALGVVKTFLLASCAKRLTWKSSNIEVHIWDFGVISALNVRIHRFRLKIGTYGPDAMRIKVTTEQVIVKDHLICKRLDRGFHTGTISSHR